MAFCWECALFICFFLSKIEEISELNWGETKSANLQIWQNGLKKSKCDELATYILGGDVVIIELHTTKPDLIASKIGGRNTFFFLDAIASPSTYQSVSQSVSGWVGQWVSEWFIVSDLEIAIASPSFVRLFYYNLSQIHFTNWNLPKAEPYVT